MDPSRGRSNRRRLAGVVVAGAASATMLLGPAGVATAQNCPITDPSCAQDLAGDVQQTDVQQPVDQTVSDTVHTAQDGVATAVDTAGSTLDGLTGVLDPPPGGDGPGGHDGGGPSDGPAGPANGHGRHSGSVAGPSVQTREGGTLIGTAIDGYADPSESDPTGERSGTTGFREAAAGIALSLLLVLGAVLLFTTIQARLDRRDPKLALAPVTADVVTFT